MLFYFNLFILFFYKWYIKRKIYLYIKNRDKIKRFKIVLQYFKNKFLLLIRKKKYKNERKNKVKKKNPQILSTPWRYQAKRTLHLEEKLYLKRLNVLNPHVLNIFCICTYFFLPVYLSRFKNFLLYLQCISSLINPSAPQQYYEYI